MIDLFVSKALAANTSFNIKLENPVKAENIMDLVNILADLFLTVASILAVLYLIWLGLQYVLAKGDSNRIKDLHTNFMYTVIGIAVIFGAKVLVEILKNTIDYLR